MIANELPVACAACGAVRVLLEEPDGTLVCDECFVQRTLDLVVV
jgi:hypothetical protein